MGKISYWIIPEISRPPAERADGEYCVLTATGQHREVHFGPVAGRKKCCVAYSIEKVK